MTISTVMKSLPPPDRAILSNLLDRSKRIEEVEAFAKEKLSALREQNPETNKTRYKFTQLSARDECLKIYFDRSFKENPVGIAAPFCSTWKRVVWIQIPRGVEQVAQSPLFKVAASVAFFYLSWVSFYRVYQATEHFLTAKGIPFLINHTPVVVIRMGNYVAGGLEWVGKNQFKSAFYAWVAREALLLLPIPRVNALARRIDPWGLFWMQGQGLSTFVWEEGVKYATFAWEGCDTISSFFEGIAQKHTHAHKKEAYAAYRALAMRQENASIL